MAMEEESSVLSRAEGKYEARYNRFILHSKNYVQQYNQVYLERLGQMKDHLRLAINEFLFLYARIITYASKTEKE
jgi:hypothetical protein